MKFFKWIVSKKIIMIAPMLTLVLAVVFVYAYNLNADNAQNTGTAPTILATAASGSIAPEAVGTSIGQPTPDDQGAGTAKAVLKVDGMTCSSCISNIKSSLAGFDGIQDIIVNLSGGFAEIYYDSQKIKDVTPFASAITASGYPASVKRILTAEQLEDEEALAAQRAEFYIASVGGWDISRSDFDTELAIAKVRYQAAYGPDVFSDERGQSVLNSMKVQIASRLINEGIQMQEVQRMGYRVEPKTFAEEFDRFISQKEISLDQFKKSLAQSGYPFEYFVKKFENRVLLRRYIEERIIQAGSNDYDKQQQYLAWFGNARQLSNVVIYDKEVQRLSQEQSSGGGCGSTCSR